MFIKLDIKMRITNGLIATTGVSAQLVAGSAVFPLGLI